MPVRRAASGGLSQLAGWPAQPAPRSINARFTRLTYDHLRLSVCRVHLPDDDDWLLRERRAIGDRIRVRRIRQNLTQERVHLAAGISRSVYQDTESGHGNPTINT